MTKDASEHHQQRKTAEYEGHFCVPPPAQMIPALTSFSCCLPGCNPAFACSEVRLARASWIWMEVASMPYFCSKAERLDWTTAM